MSRSSTIVRGIAVMATSAALAGCATGGSRPSSTAAGPPTYAEAQAAAEKAAQAARERSRGMTFEQFEAATYKEPFPGGKYIVNGDTPIVDSKHLREFFEKQVQQEPAPVTSNLIVNQVGGVDTIWNSTEKYTLTYCVSTEFGPHHDQVVTDIAAATQAWEQVADVRYTHVEAQDASCTASNQNVVFDVRPVDVGGQYLARAFFPNEPRSTRNVLIDKTSFELNPGDKLQLTGILRHELGHTIGFRHEHTRPESGTCFEDNNWRPLTDYDPFSVMHYPQCNGRGDWSLTLTDNDKTGAACLYGPAPGFNVNPAACPGGKLPGGSGPTPGKALTESFQNQSVGAGAEKPYGPFAVTAGTLFQANMTGRRPAGDPDLYVRFGQPPTTGVYACRPYLSGATERCAVDVPAGETQAFVMVRGYLPGHYNLRVTHTPPATTVSLATH